MNYQELSPQGETLLKEIIDLQASDQDNVNVNEKASQALMNF